MRRRRETSCPSLTIVLVSVGLVSGACKDGPTAPSPTDVAAALPRTITSEHYAFRFSEGDRVDTGAQEAFHRWIEAFLGMPFSARIQYNKYRDRAQMQSVTGQLTNGWADPPALTVHSIHASDGHEAVHVITFPIGRPTDFWNEGIAVAFNVAPDVGVTEPRWQSKHVHMWARDLVTSGRAPALAAVMETDAFRQYGETSGYPLAGSFVWFLAERFGVAPLLDQFRGASRNDTRGTATARFERVYGRSIVDVEQEWRAFVLNRQ